MRRKNGWMPFKIDDPARRPESPWRGDRPRIRDGAAQLLPHVSFVRLTLNRLEEGGHGVARCDRKIPVPIAREHRLQPAAGILESSPRSPCLKLLASNPEGCP